MKRLNEHNNKLSSILRLLPKQGKDSKDIK
jgi:hypothetical protein